MKSSGGLVWETTSNGSEYRILGMSVENYGIMLNESQGPNVEVSWK